MNPSKNNIDTGKLIDEFLYKNRIAKSDLGKEIHRTGVSIIRYIQNSSIQTGILLDICHALKHNFFQDIADQLPTDFSVNKPPLDNSAIISEKDNEIQDLKAQIKILEAEKSVLLQAFRRE
jgi:DNA-binding Xre family transcriptional regulator